MDTCYHLYTKAFESSLLCYDEADYKTLWNIIAISALIKTIRIYCFCLMSNHFHILLSGSEEQIDDFFQLVKWKASRFLKNKYPQSEISSLKYELQPIRDSKAYCREVAYILRNPYKAGIASPYSYRWNSARIYFSPFPLAGQPVAEIPVRHIRALLQTRFPLPEHVTLSDGMITLQSFVDNSYVERMFGGSSIQLFNLIKTWNLEDIVKASHGIEGVDSYSDEEVQKGIRELCQDVFQGASPQRLDQRGLAILVRRVHARFGCSRKQLQRLLPADDTLLDRAL